MRMQDRSRTQIWTAAYELFAGTGLHGNINVANYHAGEGVERDTLLVVWHAQAGYRELGFAGASAHAVGVHSSHLQLRHGRIGRPLNRQLKGAEKVRKPSNCNELNCVCT